MCEIISFKERVRATAVEMAKVYKRTFVDKEYLIFSKSFTKREYYILSSTGRNYLHLLGIHSNLSSKEFYDRCIDESLELYDFDFTKKGRSEKEVKGSVRRKIVAIKELDKIISKDTMVEESFNKNRVSCAIATSNINATLGFSEGEKSRPKTLMEGFVLSLKSVRPDLILSKRQGEEEFDTIVVGNKNTISEFLESVNYVVKVTDSLY